MKKHSERWIELPVSPSAEQFSRIFFLMVDKLLSLTKKINGEKAINLHSVIVHETETGYAQCFKDDAYSSLMGQIALETIIFSSSVIKDWNNPLMWDMILNNQILLNPKTI